MKRYTDKKAAMYCNKVLHCVSVERWELLNAWHDSFNRWLVCDGFRAYRLESEPDGLREMLGIKTASPAKLAQIEKVHTAIEGMFDAQFTENVTEIPVDFDAVASASKRREDCTIDLGEDFPVVNARYLREAMEMLPGGKVYCQNNSRRMVSPVYVKSSDGIALILPIRRECKLHWIYRSA